MTMLVFSGLNIKPEFVFEKSGVSKNDRMLTNSKH